MYAVKRDLVFVDDERGLFPVSGGGEASAPIMDSEILGGVILFVRGKFMLNMSTFALLRGY